MSPTKPSTAQLRVVGLFAGIGGFEKGFTEAGHRVTMLCEYEQDAREVLRRHFEKADLVPDVNDLARLPEGTDVVLAGFPCQDLSQAGTMAGINGARSGLVNRVFELIERQPVPWLVLENVQNLLRLHRGAGIAHVVGRLEQLGYRWAYRVIDTRAFGLPQRRLRVFIVASQEGDPAAVLCGTSVESTWPDDATFDTRTDAYGFYWTEGNSGTGWARDSIPTLKGGSAVSIPSAPAVWRPRESPERTFVVPGIEDVEALQGFPRGWSTSQSGVSAQERRRWRMVGNAVSVPVSAWIGSRLVQNVELDDSLLGESVNGRWPLAARGGPGEVRKAIRVTSWPLAAPRLGLAGFLRSPKELSVRAAVGFYDRLEASTLRGGPPAFRIDLAEYCSRLGAKRTWTPRTTGRHA